MRTTKATIVSVVLAAAGSALGDFGGQPILGPLTSGSVVSGSTAGKADDNDGFESGIHIFDVWDGGDDVYLLNWTGGDMLVTLDSLGGSDNDLFIYSPGGYDSTSDYSIVGAHDEVLIAGAAPGAYYINVDSTLFSEGSYRLAVEAVPTPGTVSLLAGGLLTLARRRR